MNITVHFRDTDGLATFEFPDATESVIAIDGSLRVYRGRLVQSVHVFAPGEWLRIEPTEIES